ncbi:30S ribosomal protein S2 [Elysia marginata]|uniref:30S ribosomal protein S2 n=1 Tax=Elysia marginata TaxID=1093978 RepID=A0AAV4I6T3_9GAST|nr:30S ribosomal protein S2 [Elysia marginata]
MSDVDISGAHCSDIWERLVVVVVVVVAEAVVGLYKLLNPAIEVDHRSKQSTTEEEHTFAPPSHHLHTQRFQFDCPPGRRKPFCTFTNASSLFGTLPIYPELCIFFGTQDTVFETHRGVTEASKLLIPTVGIVDTNCDADPITYPVPGNDDSPASLHFYMGLFRDVILKAKEKRKKDGVQ